MTVFKGQQGTGGEVITDISVITAGAPLPPQEKEGLLLQGRKHARHGSLGMLRVLESLPGT